MYPQLGAHDPVFRQRTQLTQFLLSASKAGIVMVLFVLPGGSATKHVFIGLTLLSLTLLNLPKKTSRAQLIPLLTVTMITFLLTCLFADGTPPPTVSHVPPAAIDNLPALSTSKSYSYTIFKFWFLTITRKSVRIATSTATLLFVALQSASLCLVTTPPEELAVSVQWFLAPLKWVGIPVKQIGFTLLLSLRFLSVVFDEIRNLALGIAVRGLDWNTLGPIGTIQVLMTAINQLFVKLFRTCENVAIAMRLRGFVGPEKHHLYLLGSNHTNWLANIMAIAIIGIVIFVSKRV